MSAVRLNGRRKRSQNQKEEVDRRWRWRRMGRGTERGKAGRNKLRCSIAPQGHRNNYVKRHSSARLLLEGDTQLLREFFQEITIPTKKDLLSHLHHEERKEIKGMQGCIVTRLFQTEDYDCFKQKTMNCQLYLYKERRPWRVVEMTKPCTQPLYIYTLVRKRDRKRYFFSLCHSYKWHAYKCVNQN